MDPLWLDPAASLLTFLCSGTSAPTMHPFIQPNTRWASHDEVGANVCTGRFSEIHAFFQNFVTLRKGSTECALPGS